MAREVYPTSGYITRTEKITPNLDLDGLLAEIDSLPTEEIGFGEYLRLNVKMVRLLKKAKKL